jgi:hypothetical protein
MKKKRKVFTDLIYSQKCRVWSVSRLLRHIIFTGCQVMDTAYDTSVSTAAIAAQGSYRLCREVNRRNRLVQA